MTLKERLHQYHTLFKGDTYDACARCRGKCEQYKIATLMPGEKEYMAERLGLTVNQFEDSYLSRLDTPFGFVDVLKMKDGCPFLDNLFRCTATDVKPVLCDSYPIVFEINKNRIRFIIDNSDCPMVHWPEYRHVVESFKTRGIPALKAIKAPNHWWKIVSLYDTFDVDYRKIEKELSKTAGYDTFYLEVILGYACGGYEMLARKKGFALIERRMGDALQQAVGRLSRYRRSSKPFVRQMALSYQTNIKEQVSLIIDAVQKGRKDESILAGKGGTEYRRIVLQALNKIVWMDRETENMILRVKAGRR